MRARRGALAAFAQVRKEQRDQAQKEQRNAPRSAQRRRVVQAAAGVRRAAGSSRERHSVQPQRVELAAARRRANTLFGAPPSSRRGAYARRRPATSFSTPALAITAGGAWCVRACRVALPARPARRAPGARALAPRRAAARRWPQKGFGPDQPPRWRRGGPTCLRCGRPRSWPCWAWATHTDGRACTGAQRSCRAHVAPKS
jgi:hypothetical protein